MSYAISACGIIWQVREDCVHMREYEAAGNLFPTQSAAEEELARRIAAWNEKYNPPTKRITPSFEVKLRDEPHKYTWHEAMTAFDNNPVSQWSLPTKRELAIMYENREKIGGFGKGCYWSSSENYVINYSWTQQFSDGAQYYSYKSNSFAVRLLRKKEQQ